MTYQTKGSLEVSVFSRTGTVGDVNAALSIGSIGKATIFLTLEGLQRLRQLIIEAKAKLETAA